MLTSNYRLASHIFHQSGVVELNDARLGLIAQYFVVWFRDGVMVHEDHYHCYQYFVGDFFSVLEAEIASAESVDWYDEVIVGELKPYGTES